MRSTLRRRAPDLLLVVFLVVWTVWQAQHLDGFYWDSDEGLNLMKARLVQLGDPLYSAIWSDQPPALTLVLAAAFQLAGPTIGVARGVVLAHAVVGLLATAWLVQLTGGGGPARLGAVVALAMAPNAFWAARAVMIGLPALSLLLAALALIVAGLRSRQRGLLGAGGVVLGLSLLEKLLGLVVLPAVGLAVLLAAVGFGSSDRGAAWWQAARDGAWIVVGVLAPWLVALLLFDAGAMLPQILGGVLTPSDAYVLDRAENLEDIGHWLWGEHRMLLGFAVLGIVRLAADLVAATRGGSSERAPATYPPAVALLLLWLLATVAALVERSPLWPKHHLLSLLVILAPLTGFGLEVAWRATRRIVTGHSRRGDGLWAAAGALAVAVLLAGLPAAAAANAARVTVLPYKASGELPEHSDAWRRMHEAVAMVQRHVGPEELLLTDHGVVAFMSGRRVPPALAVISGKRIATGDLDRETLLAEVERAAPAAVLLWDHDRLQRIDGLRAWVEQRYDRVDNLDGAWELWRRRPAAP